MSLSQIVRNSFVSALVVGMMGCGSNDPSCREGRVYKEGVGCVDENSSYDYGSSVDTFVAKDTFVVPKEDVFVVKETYVAPQDTYVPPQDPVCKYGTSGCDFRISMICKGGGDGYIITSMDPNGKDWKVLGSFPGRHVQDSSWSYNNKRLVFTSGYFEGDTNQKVSIFDILEGTEDILINSEKDCSEVDWSSKDQIAAKCNNGIYILNSDGTNQKNVLPNVKGYNPSWSADGNLLFYYIYSFQGIESGGIHMYDTKTGSDILIPNQPFDHCYVPSPHPLDSKLLMSCPLSSSKDTTYGLYLANFNVSGLKQLKQLEQGKGASTDFISSSWSPDGTYIVHGSLQEPTDISILNLNTNKSILIYDGDNGCVSPFTTH